MIGSEWLVKGALAFLVMLPASLIGESANSAFAEVALAATALTAVIVLWRKGLKPILAGLDRMHTMYEAIVGTAEKPGLVDQVAHIENNQQAAADRLSDGDGMLHSISDQVADVGGQLAAIGERTAGLEGRMDALQPIVEAMAGASPPRRHTPARRATDA